MTYIGLHRVYRALNSSREFNATLDIQEMFSRRLTEVGINKKTQAKKFGMSRSKLSTLFTKLIKYNFIIELEAGTYRMNPFMYIPHLASGAILQEEWTEIIEKNEFKRRGLSVEEYKLKEDGKLGIIDFEKILLIS